MGNATTDDNVSTSRPERCGAMTGAEIRLSIAELPESFPAFHVAVALVQGIALGEDRDSDVEAFVAAAEGQARDALSNMAPADFPEI